MPPDMPPNPPPSTPAPAALERAARAIERVVKAARQTPPDNGSYEHEARYVLSAAFADPADDDMRDAVGDALVEEFERLMRERGGWSGDELARAALTALRQYVQGGGGEVT